MGISYFPVFGQTQKRIYHKGNVVTIFIDGFIFTPVVCERKHTLPSPKPKQNKAQITFMLMLDMYPISESAVVSLYMHI